jgi:hypothetical protein
MIKYLLLILICSLLNATITEVEYGGAEDYRIVEYDLTVRIPGTFDRLEVDALVAMEKISREKGQWLGILLGKNFRGVKVMNISVSDSRSEAVPFSFEDSILAVDLTDIYGKVTTSWLLIEYDLVKDTSFYDEFSPFSLEISDSLCHVNAAITRTDNWYPKIAGTMANRLAPFKLTIDVPAKFEVMASGKLQDVVIERDRKTYVWQNYEGVTDRSLYFFAQEQAKTVKEFDDGLRVVMYAPSIALDENIDFLAGVVHKSYRYFENIYGELPWNEYKMMSFAYGYSGLFNSSNAPASLFNSEIVHNDIYFPTRSVIHEVSHTWWGNVVSSNADENYWLYEGFGKYSEIVGIESALGADVESLSFFRLKLCTLPYIDYVPSIKNAQNADDRVLVNVAAYYMGSTYLRMLRHLMGEENFYKGIRHYVRDSWGKCISTDDFFRAMKKYCRKEYHQIITDYITKPGYARYEIERLGVELKNGEYIHKYSISNFGDKDIFVPYRVKSDLEEYTKDLFVKKSERVIVRVLSRQNEAIDHITIDPDEIFPVCRAGLKGPGATVYENQQGEVKAYNIAVDAPFARAGITEDMSLVKIDGVELAGNDLRALNHMLLRHDGEEIVFLVRSGEADPYEITVRY